MRILIVTPRSSNFTDFLTALAESGVETSLAPTGQAALDQAKIDPPTLAVVDAVLPDGDSFVFVAKLMRTNAAIHTAVVSQLSPEAFHEAGEGLGILTVLPPHPSAKDAHNLFNIVLSLC
jgi:DNA-binding response OmpR family regulator